MSLFGKRSGAAMTPSPDIARLVEIMAALRTPATGCPWDLEQDFSTIAPYTIEEAYEVADAIERGDMVELKEELGDLLLQVVYHARLAEEAGLFAFPDVVQAITRKMIRRHPHVFGDEEARSAGMAKGAWNRIKAEEKAARAEARGGEARPGDVPATSALAGVTVALPGLTRAVKLQDKAGAVGFDWNDARAVLAKIREEADEIEAALEGADQAAREEEIGDLLFVVANLARHLAVDPEAALRAACGKFTSRFLSIEAALEARGKTAKESTLAEMDALWDEAKRAERA
jgi:ATP diphosphatase